MDIGVYYDKKKNSQSTILQKIFYLYQLFSLLQLLFSLLALSTIGLFTIITIFFEDRVIDEQNLKYDEELGIKNEWLLGVTTDSIDVLEATYNEDIKNHIYRKALSQQEVEKFYREKIDNKELIYCISLTPQNGEFFL